MTPTPPLTARIVVVEPDEWETGLAAILNSLRPHLSENLWVDASCSIEAVLREALAAVRAEADGLRAAIPADPWVWLVRREGHARCYACDTPWSEAEAHAPDCAWLAATTPEGGA